MRAGILTIASLSGTDPFAGLVASHWARVWPSGFHPCNKISWASASAHTVGQWSRSVFGSIPTNCTAMTGSLF